jgi:hypothetical protein
MRLAWAGSASESAVAVLRTGRKPIRSAHYFVIPAQAGIQAVPRSAVSRAVGMQMDCALSARCTGASL